MRNPVRGESDAFYIAFGSALLIGASAALGALVDPWVGVALFVGGLIGAFIWEISTRDPERRRSLKEAAAAGPGASAHRRRVLVIANRTLAADGLRRELRARGSGGAELHLVAPILSSRAHYITTDLDSELREARERLDEALTWARSQGLDAGGRVGDPNAELGAIEDELRIFGADEVIISTLAPGRSNWLETGIVERLREELDIPVTHIIDAPAQVPAPEPAPGLY
jgi:GABA permease